jgi:uncharacterized protein (TIGR03437 family)
MRGKNRKVFWAKVAVIAVTVPVLIQAYEYGPDAGNSGVPGETTCAQAGCHVGTAVNGGPGSVNVTFPGGLSYVPGVKQHLVVTITDPTMRRWGFQATARLSGNAKSQAGSFTPSDLNTQTACASSALTQETIPGPAAGCPAAQPLQYIEHTLQGYNRQQSSPATYEFDWTPPATDVGNVVFYVAGNAANGDLTSNGDRIYTKNFTLTPSAASGGLKPAISQNGVVNGASFAQGISAGSWVTIQGTNLAGTTRTWRSDEIVNGRLPTQLDGVSVSVNNKAAAVYYISPTQVNVQAPADTNLGPVNVTVTNNGSTSDAATAQLQQYSPAFFLWNGKYTVATRPDFSYVGPAGLFQGLTTVPAKPGDAVILWGTGFGPTNPDVPAGQTVPSNLAPAITGNLTVTVGGINATVLGAVLSPGFAGLYQIAITVPATASSGDLPVVATIGGVSSPSGVVLAVQQ